MEIKEGKIEWSKDEPYFRSCWECNTAHEHLKKDKLLFNCFECGRFYFFGKYLDTFETQVKADTFIKEVLA